MQTTKLYVQLYENNIETGLEKKKKIIESIPPPPFSGNSNPFCGGGVWIFSVTTHSVKSAKKEEFSSLATEVSQYILAWAEIFIL